MRVLDVFRQPLVAIDVGTANTRLSFGASRLRERPSVVREELGGTAVIRSVMRGGVVADIAGVASVVERLLAESAGRFRRRPAALVCAPSDASDRERDALIEAVAAGGASVVSVVPEPLAAAIGCGLDVASEHACAIVDIGDGVTDIAVLKNASIASSGAKRLGCGTLRAAIHDWLELRQRPAATLSGQTIDDLVRAYCRHDLPSYTIATGSAPLRVPRDDLETLLDPVLDAIASFVATTLRDLPDHLAAEVIESGIHVSGGGANLPRLVTRIEERVGLPVRRAAEPLKAVIRGATAMLKNARLLAGTQQRQPG